MECLGASFGIGMRKAPLKKVDPISFIHDGEVVNTVSFDRRLNEPGRGIEMHFDIELQKLIIQVFFHVLWQRIWLCRKH